MIYVNIKSEDNNMDCLHPREQVLEVKKIVESYNEEDIVINTISPFIVEAFTIYCLDCGLIDDLMYELNGEKISPYNSKSIYKNLSQGYDILDEVKLKLEFGDD